MFRKILCLALMCGVVLSLGCGEEEETLSELIVGSWRNTDPELSGRILVPFDGGTLIAEMSSTLTFYGDTRFDNVFQVSVTQAGEPVGNMKAITQGIYEAFDSSVVLRAKSSEMQAVPPDFAAFAESGFSPMMEGLESMFTDTLPASIQGQTLILDGTRWRKF